MLKNRCYSWNVYNNIIVIGETYEKCIIGSIKIIKLFLTLSFIIHSEKSSSQPSQEIIYLRFSFISKEVIVTITSEKREKSIESCKGFLKRDSFTIRKLSSLIGTLTSTFPGNKFGKTEKSKRHFWHKHIKLTKEAALDLQWWIKNLFTVIKKSYSAHISGGSTRKITWLKKALYYYHYYYYYINIIIFVIFTIITIIIIDTIVFILLVLV